jgi:ribosome modulation factor
MNKTPQLPQGVYSEGADSFLHGLPREDCPYPPGADEREAWLAGWDQTARKDAADVNAK